MLCQIECAMIAIEINLKCKEENIRMHYANLLYADYNTIH